MMKQKQINDENVATKIYDLVVKDDDAEKIVGDFLSKNKPMFDEHLEVDNACFKMKNGQTMTIFRSFTCSPVSRAAPCIVYQVMIQDAAGTMIKEFHRFVSMK